MMRRPYLYFGVLLCLTGCGSGDHPDTVPVTGVVTFGGRPLDGVRVVFNTQDTPRSATATTAMDGSFSLSTYNRGDGAIPGSYVVTVERILGDAADANAEESFQSMEGEAYTKAMLASATGKSEAGKDNDFPAKYADRKNSGLAYQIKAGEKNHFEITLQ